MKTNSFFVWGWAALVAGSSLALAETPPAPPPAIFEVFAALPQDPNVGLRLEAAMVWADLGQTGRNLAAERARLKQTRLGEAFYETKAQVEAFGFDPLAELDRLLELAGPGGKPVPAAIAFFAGPQGPGLQLMVKVEQGFLARLGQALAGPTPPAFEAQITDDTLELPIGQRALLGRVGEDGWLRVAPDQAMLVPGGGVPAFTGTLRKWTQDCEALLFVQGGGMIMHDLAAELDSPPLAEILRATRNVVLGWKSEAEGTSVARLLVDVPQLEAMRAAVRQPDLANSLARVWDDQTSGFFSLSLPPLATNMLAPLLEKAMSGSEIQPSTALLDGLAKLDGRLGLVTFDSTDDWAFAIGLRDAETARAVVPALHDFLLQAMAKLEAHTEKSYVLESFPGAKGPVIHMRPNTLLQGMRIANVGNAVVAVRQRARLARLLEMEALPIAERPPVAGPVTQPMRAALETPAMILGYLLLGVDGAILEWAGWMASGAEAAFAKEKPQFPGADLVGRVLAQLPTILSLQGVALSLTYDAAVSVDLEASVLVIQLFASEV